MVSASAERVGVAPATSAWPVIARRVTPLAGHRTAVYVTARAPVRVACASVTISTRAPPAKIIWYVRHA